MCCFPYGLSWGLFIQGSKETKRSALFKHRERCYNDNRWSQLAKQRNASNQSTKEQRPKNSSRRTIMAAHLFSRNPCGKLYII